MFLAINILISQLPFYHGLRQKENPPLAEQATDRGIYLTIYPDLELESLNRAIEIFKKKLTMKIGIMQPYFLPYIGYYQLMKSVDTFVFYDDVAYIKQGWINRNRILLNGHDYLFIMQLNGASQNKKINAIEIGNNRMNLLMTFKCAYGKAPFYKDVEPLLHSIFESEQRNLSRYIINTNKLIADYLGIDTKILISSEIEKDNNLKRREDRIFEICNKFGATTYINAIGGRDLYSKADFAQAGIDLYFIKSQLKEYPQFNNNFITSLSIIDVMMFNSIDVIQAMLNNYKLL